MEEKKSLTLLEEEILCEKVREFPIIYDKAQKGHKEKDAVTNCWNATAKDLDFTENGWCNFLICFCLCEGSFLTDIWVWLFFCLFVFVL